MQKLFLIFSAALIGAFTTTAGAYTPQDQATITITPAKDWTAVPNILSNETNTLKYEKRVPKMPNATLTKRQETKAAHNDPNILINQMGDILKKGLTSKGCEVGLPMLEPQVSDEFKVWVQVYQCKQVKLTGLQYYIDADPQLVYLLTYTSNDYPFTAESRDKAEKEVRSMIQVCYNGKACTPVQ